MEHRGSPRVDTHLAVQLSAKSTKRKGRLLNASALGFFVQTSTDGYRLHQLVTVNLSLRDADGQDGAFIFRGRIVRIEHQWRTGIALELEAERQPSTAAVTFVKILKELDELASLPKRANQ